MLQTLKRQHKHDGPSLPKSRETKVRLEKLMNKMESHITDTRPLTQRHNKESKRLDFKNKPNANAQLRGVSKDFPQ